MPTSQPTKELASKLDQIGHISEGLKTCVRKHVSNSVQDRSADDRSAMVLAYRAIKFLDAYLLVARKGYLEPSATLTRSIYETYLWSRWVLCGNGQKYLDTGKSQAVQVMKKLHKHGELSPDSQASGALTYVSESVPNWFEMAKQTGMEVFHDMVYPHFSNLSHGNLYGSVDHQLRLVSFDPDFTSMEPTTTITHALAAHTWKLFDDWWTNGTLAPPPF